MLVVDARTIDSEEKNVVCDVCIVGAGAAGIYLGTRLVHIGLNVVILEAGGRICSNGEAVGIESVFEGEPYRGATEGRAFGLGGSTSSWGGYLVPYSDCDITTVQQNTYKAWQHIVKTVKERSSVVLTTLGLDATTFREKNTTRFMAASMSAFDSCGLDVAMGEFLPFRRKNMAGLLRKSKYGNGRLTIFLNSVATEWHNGPVSNGVSRLKSTKTRGGKNIKISAASFVLAAGAIESTRILLEMQQQLVSSPFRRGAAIGRYLGDHLSCSIANVPPEDRQLAVRLFAPLFIRGRLRNFRFIEHSAPMDLPRSFAHFIFENENAGFNLAKKLLGGFQSRSLPVISLKELTRGATGLFALGWNRVMRSRLYIASETPVHLQLDVEQHPNFNNCIRLGDQKDSLGRSTPIIRWGVHEEDYKTIRKTSIRLLSLWPGKRKGLPNLIAAQGEPSDRKPHDAYHPVGTCRMGTDTESVVDLELRVHGFHNLSVLSTAVFPTAGTANPTFSMFCLAEALAERLGREIIR